MQSESQKRYYHKNKQKAIDSAKKWKKSNPLKVIESDRIYRLKNKDKIRKYNSRYIKEHYLEHKKIVEKYKERKNYLARIYRKLHPEKARAYVSFRRATDIQYKLKMALRHRIYLAIKNNQKSGSAVKALGCTVEHLKKHIESLFQPGMNWNNWTYTGWHIDHIKALSTFDLTDTKQFADACHYTNLQPLWWKDNIIKSNK
jgi:hypothetical protein